MRLKIHRPVAGEFEISSPYGERTHPVTGQKGKMHYGIDFKTPVGTPVVASVTGKVVRAGWENPSDRTQGFGMRVWQYEADRDLFVAYAHLSEISIGEGDEVVAGTRIGLSGDTGGVEIKKDGRRAAHLHHEARIGGIAGVKGTEIEYVEAAVV